LVSVICTLVLASACSASPHHVATPTAAPQATAAPASTHLDASIAPWHLTARRSRAVALVDSGRILVLGGLAAGTSTPSVLSIDPAAGSVVHAGTLVDAVHDAAGAVIGGAPRVFGGGGATTVDAVQTYAPSGSRITAHLPRPRSDLAAVSLGETAFIAGGFDGTRLSPYVVSTADGSTFKVAGTLATAVRYPAIAALGESVYVIGGSTATTESSAGGQVDLVQRYDIATGKTVVVAHLPHALAHASAFVLGGELYVAGGVDGRRPLDEIFRIDGSSVQPAGTLPGPRSDAAVATIGDTVWLIGGENGGPAAPLDSVVVVRPAR
jgi:Kelch motif